MTTVRKPLSLGRMVALALLVALSIVLKRFLGYNDRVISVSFGFVPIAAAGMLMGIPGGLMAAVAADVIGALLFPTGPFHPGFTVQAALSGLCYGYFLHKEPLSKQRIALCQVLITLLLHVGLNTYLLMPIVGKGFLALLPLRLLKNVLFFPVEVFVLQKLNEYRHTLARLLR